LYGSETHTQNMREIGRVKKNHATIHYSTILALIIGAWSIARAKSEA